MNRLVFSSLVATTVANLIPCFYNTAYEENNFLDHQGYTLKTAKNCYVLIDTDNFNSHDAVINYTNALKINNNTIGCYMSVGTVEDWRSDFQQFIKGQDYQSKGWPEWPGEYMIKAGSDGKIADNVVSLMKKRIDKFSKLGCEYIEFDNMDIDEYNKMTNINGNAMRAYNLELCNYVHSNKLKCMAKNTGPSDADDNIFDGLSVESYPKELNWWGTEHALNFTNNNKPFMISHYKENTVKDCLKIWKYYRGVYKYNKFGFICSQYETKHYIHYIHFGYKINLTNLG